MAKRLPDFIVAGVARAGTTWLHHVLSQHESVFLTNVKEVNFFSNVESKNPEDYYEPQPDKTYHTKIINDWKTYKKLYKKANEQQLRGDISPSYMWDKNSAKRLREANKDIKIIISLRSPVSRAFSHYKMNYYTGYEKESSFLKAIDKTSDGFWGGGNCYIDCSYYYESLKTYFDNFNKDNILIVIYEEWIEDQKNLIDNITDFLGIEDFQDYSFNSNYQNKIKPIKYLGTLNFLRNNTIKHTLKKIIPQNKIDYFKRKYFEGDECEMTIPEEEEDKLKTVFREDIEKTGKLLDKDLLSLWGFE